MVSYQEFDDGVLVTIDGEDEPRGPASCGLEPLERSVEMKLAGDTDSARIAIVRDAMNRLKFRTSGPEQNHDDYYLIVRYLLRGRLS